jgi:N-hydroxyarylamine O-acetyltransferase
LAHLLAVPFENLSIHRGERIFLEDQALFEKIVRRRRGGFCYELNGLFGSLLRALGFHVDRVSAAVMGGDGQFGPPFDHMALVISLQQRWLVDVGFGDSFREPLRLDDREEQAQGARSYRLDLRHGCYTLWQRERDGNWQAQYRFDLTPHAYAAYAAMCHFHQTSPESHFTQRRICTRATPDGRITLSDLRLITTTNGARHERQLPDEAAFAEALRTHFGIELA